MRKGRPIKSDSQPGPITIESSSNKIVSVRKNEHYKILKSFIRFIINSKLGKNKKSSKIMEKSNIFSDNFPFKH